MRDRPYATRSRGIQPDEIQQPTLSTRPPPQNPSTAIVLSSSVTPSQSITSQSSALQPASRTFSEIDPTLARPDTDTIASYGGATEDLKAISQAISEGHLIQRHVSPLSIPIQEKGQRDVTHDMKSIVRTIILVIGNLMLRNNFSCDPIAMIEKQIFAQLHQIHATSPHDLMNTFSNADKLLSTLMLLVKITVTVIAGDNQHLRLGIVTRMPDKCAYWVESHISACPENSATIWVFCETNTQKQITKVPPIGHPDFIGGLLDTSRQLSLFPRPAASSSSVLGRRRREDGDDPVEQVAFIERSNRQLVSIYAAVPFDLPQHFTSREIMQQFADQLSHNSLLRVAIDHDDREVWEHMSAKFLSTRTPTLHPSNRAGPRIVANRITSAIDFVAKLHGLDEVMAGAESSTLLLRNEFDMARQIHAVAVSGVSTCPEVRALRIQHQDQLKAAMRSLQTWPPKGPVAAQERQHLNDEVHFSEDALFERRVEQFLRAPQRFIPAAQKYLPLDATSGFSVGAAGHMMIGDGRGARAMLGGGKSGQATPQYCNVGQSSVPTQQQPQPQPRPQPSGGFASIMQSLGQNPGLQLCGP